MELDCNVGLFYKQNLAKVDTAILTELYFLLPSVITDFFHDQGIGFRVPTGVGSSRPSLGHTEPLFQWITANISAGRKWPRSEDNSSPLSNSKNECRRANLTLYLFNPLKTKRISFI
jgi:hypothetical protein